MTAGERLTADSDPEVRARHVARYERAIALAGRIGGTWWDVACGDGYGTAMMPAECAVGFDREDAWSQGDGAVFHMADLTAPTWWQYAVRPDVILCIETLEHLPRATQQRLVSDFHALLRPGGVLVLACPIGDGPSAVNPWHLHEPTEGELRDLLAHFRTVSIELEEYESTSGPAVQAFAVCHV